MTLKELLTAWAERDRRYGVRYYGGRYVPLSPGEVASIKAWRLNEARDIESEQNRALALLKLARWTAPGPRPA